VDGIANVAVNVPSGAGTVFDIEYVFPGPFQPEKFCELGT
jgi:hypothetical protein